MNQLGESGLAQVPVRKIQVGCMIATGILGALGMITGCFTSGAAGIAAVGCENMAAALFLGISLGKPLSKEGRMLLKTGLLMCAWILFLQILDLKNFSLEGNYYPQFSAVAAACEYVMMLSFGCVLAEKGKDSGLKAAGIIFVAASVGLCLLSVMFLLNAYPAALFPMMNWWNARLAMMWNPNVLASLFMTATALCMMFACTARKLAAKVGFCYLAVLEYLMMTLAYSRAVLLCTCCIIGGVVLFLIYKGKSRKRLVLGLLAAMITVCLLVSLSGAIFQIHAKRVGEVWGRSEGTENSGQAAEDKYAEQTAVEEREIFEHSFNGRTTIWKGALQAIAEHPKILVVGATRGEIRELLTQNCGRLNEHCHNAWIQVLMRTGIPGLVFALYITWLAVKNAFLLCFRKKSLLYQKIIALLVVAMLGAEFFEVYIFLARYPDNFLDAIFMLCVGYLVYWVRTMPDLEPEKAISAEESVAAVK